MGRRHEPQEALGRAILQLRDERGMTQAALARAADTDNTRISHLENGRTNPAWGTVRRIAAALGVPVSEIAARAEQLDREGVKPTVRGAVRRGRRAPSRQRP
jgi:transcriptional regulator with XRE-family HTH domain